MMVFASLELPTFGDAGAPMHRVTSPSGTPVAGSYYISNAYRDAGTDNIVTVVLADYRGFDTLGETVVVFAAGGRSVLFAGDLSRRGANHTSIRSVCDLPRALQPWRRVSGRGIGGSGGDFVADR